MVSDASIGMQSCGQLTIIPRTAEEVSRELIGGEH